MSSDYPGQKFSSSAKAGAGRTAAAGQAGPHRYAAARARGRNPVAGGGNCLSGVCTAAMPAGNPVLRCGGADNCFKLFVAVPTNILIDRHHISPCEIDESCIFSAWPARPTPLIQVDFPCSCYRPPGTLPGIVKIGGQILLQHAVQFQLDETYRAPEEVRRGYGRV